MKTFEDIRAMSNEEINQRIRELTNILDMQMMDNTWNEAYREYDRLNFVLDERWRKECQADFDAFYKEHIKGKSWEEINTEDWDFYSDWHKDMYGFRPKHI